MLDVLQLHALKILLGRVGSDSDWGPCPPPTCPFPLRTAPGDEWHLLELNFFYFQTAMVPITLQGVVPIL